MLEVDQVKECKQLFAKGMGIRAIARQLEMSRNTVRGYVRGERLPGQYQMAAPRTQPVADAVRPVVQALLEQEIQGEVPRKQRLTAARIHRLVGKEHDLCESTTRRIVRELRLELRDPLEHAYLPLEYDPGHDAQVDFFEAVYDDLDHGRTKVFVLLVRACYSGRGFAYVAPNQTRESLLEGLIRSFEFFGGVFLSLWFDNLTPAVKKVLKGRTRLVQEAFKRFQAHYGFEACFCRPGKGNEKGGVEGEVKFARHEIFSPIPACRGRGELQALAQVWMDEELQRKIRGREVTIGEAWEKEVPVLMALPSGRFDPSQSRATRVSPRSWISFGTNQYSAPVEWVGHPVDVRISAETIEIRHRSGEVAIHPRCYGSNEMSLQLDHYLPLLERKHRGLDRAAPVRRWLSEVPPCWKEFLRVLRTREGEVDGSKAFVEALYLCRTWGTAEVTAAVQQALSHPEVSVAAVRYHLWRQAEQSSAPVGQLPVAGPKVQDRSAAEFMVLLGGGASA